MSKDSDPDISDSDPDPGVSASDSDVCDHGEIQNGYYYEFCHICKKYFCENNDENHESCKKKKCTEKDFEETKMSETNIEKQLDELVNEKDVTDIHQEMYIKYVIFKLGSRQESRFSMWSPKELFELLHVIFIMLLAKKCIDCMQKTIRKLNFDIVAFQEAGRRGRAAKKKCDALKGHDDKWKLFPDKGLPSQLSGVF